MALGLADMLAAVSRNKASDLHLAPGRPPFLRVDGSLIPLPGAETVSLTAADLEQNVLELCRHAGAAEVLPRSSLDGALRAADGARFRFHVYRRAPGFAIALRRLEDRFRSLTELGLSESLSRWGELGDGLLLVAGPTGSGKSTTLATLIDLINQRRACHVITIEDPIEYVHSDQKSLVDQRQVGLHTGGFQDALVASLRQDPDVILVGEIRERDTIRIALTAAETGHLVFTTVHAPDCAGALQRLGSVFPADEQPGVLRQLALNLRGILTQHLVPADGPGRRQRPRILLSEILQVTPAAANLIANGKFNQMQTCMETGGSEGMQTLEENLIHWIQEGFLTEGAAMSHTRRPAYLRQRLQRHPAGRSGR
ncbi:MAG: PilT/PilU family type 4a pilus ATPase [Verrucomicrobia bacterium]|nr:PilT/PilU family type 4a pilus ATPase [Verrucomicrobiota bacterium]MCH8527621.1 PilT/PilU family type 4a pilus ATPase [Kiritimatiellia bacterium]